MPDSDKNILGDLVQQLPADTPYAANATYQEHLLAQYKLYVEMTDHVNSRRQTANTFFLSINTALIGLLGYINPNYASQSEMTFLWIIAVAGISLGYLWYRIMRSYLDLNTAKFQVIHNIEKHLPLTPYAAEWASMGKGKDPKLPFVSTHIEILIPWIFMFLCFMALLLLFPWKIFNFVSS